MRLVDETFGVGACLHPQLFGYPPTTYLPLAAGSRRDFPVKLYSRTCFPLVRPEFCKHWKVIPEIFRELELALRCATLAKAGAHCGMLPRARAPRDCALCEVASGACSNGVTEGFLHVIAAGTEHVLVQRILQSVAWWISLGWQQETKA